MFAPSLPPPGVLPPAMPPPPGLPPPGVLPPSMPPAGMQGVPQQTSGMQGMPQQSTPPQQGLTQQQGVQGMSPPKGIPPGGLQPLQPLGMPRAAQRAGIGHAAAMSERRHPGAGQPGQEAKRGNPYPRGEAERGDDAKGSSERSPANIRHLDAGHIDDAVVLRRHRQGASQGLEAQIVPWPFP